MKQISSILHFRCIANIKTLLIIIEKMFVINKILITKLKRLLAMMFMDIHGLSTLTVQQ